MMGRSHTLIGLATVTALAAANFWPLSPAVLAATAIGSLAPNIDHPQSTFGQPLFFVSYPMNATIGHRTGTHSFLALAFCTLGVLIAEAAGYANVGYGFLVGYVAHIGADLLTIEGCALLYPWDRARYAFWPAVQTGSLGEAVILLPILGLILGIAYWLNPPFFDAARQLRLHVPFLFHVPVT
jgi:inner membrane protein